jgi:hypothetical protein
MEWRLQQEIDRAYTQCIIDVSFFATLPRSRFFFRPPYILRVLPLSLT